jgi:hypothetical protein
MKRMFLRVLALSTLLAAPAFAQAQLPIGIETQQLRQLDAWSVSALSPAQGALPATLWAHTDPVFLAAALDRLPSVYESPAAQALARRTLLSGGDAPRGDASVAARKRFEALGKMGAADDLSVMAAGSGGALNDPAIAMFAAQAELARGRRAEACARGRQASSETPSPFLLRLRAYCAAVGGDRAAAELALELARGSGADDAWYTGAIVAAAGAPSARPPAARYENSLTAQLSLAAQLRPGPNPLTNASTLALTALARSDATPQPIRAQAAALAFRRGAISAADARAVLRATPPEIVSALPPIAAAMRTVEASPGSIEAAAAISTVLRQATAPADFHAVAAFFKDDIAALAAAPDSASAMTFARAAIATGDVALAQRLVASARAAGLEPAALAPLEAALAASMGVTGEQALMAAHRRVDAAGASLSRAAARDVAIFAALAWPLDGGLQAFLLANPPQGGARADAGALANLQAAVDRGAIGDVAILAVVASGDGPARLDADSLGAIIRALRAAGLADDARRFAVEALLAGQPS